MQPTLLFIEDNEDILANLFSWFEARNFSCDCARNGNAGLELAVGDAFDCVILDIMLPGLNGLELCRKLRALGKNMPIIMLTAKDSLDDRIAGLDCGADDYIVKPFSLRELEARIMAVLRRTRPHNQAIVCGDVEVDSARHIVHRNGVRIHLSPTGFRIMEALFAAAPGIVRKETLEKMLWGEDAPEGSALRNHIHELRKALDKPFETQLLETIPHIGWRLNL